MVDAGAESILREATGIVQSGRDIPEALISPTAEALLSAEVAEETRIRFLSALADKGETPGEVAGFALTYLPHAVDPGLRGKLSGRAMIDCCGTGGGGVNLVNISTAIMFVMAAAGVPVVKHGNKGLTKKSGSADVLGALGVRIDLVPEQSLRMLEEVGCCFYMAPHYHPAFKAVAGARQTLGAGGKRTIFNYLGPLLNPARPEAQMVGLFRPEGLDFYHQCLETMGRRRFVLVYGESESGQPVGEASVIGSTRIQGSLDGARVDEVITAGEKGSLDTLLVNSAEESARRIESALGDDPEENLLRRMLALNAGLGLWVQGTAASPTEGIDLARQIIDDGRARETLIRAREFSAKAFSN